MSIRFTHALRTSLVALAFSAGAAFAQQPRYLAADIPLDVNAVYEELQPEENYPDTTRDIIRQLQRNHYADLRLNDEFSSDMLDRYIEMLDGSRLYFTQQDINEFEQYRRTLDDMLTEGDLDVGYLIHNRYQHRLIERLVHSVRLLENEETVFDFTEDDSLLVDRSEAPWASSEEELRDLWRKRVKSAVLSQKMNAEEDQDEDFSSADDASAEGDAGQAASDAQRRGDFQMAETRQELVDRYRSQLSQVLKTNNLDVYQRYMDAMTMTLDPHTQYYAPRAAENFNMNMRLSLEGIGAVLSTEDEYTKVMSIVSGGPADMAGELQPSDRIVGVAQGDQEFTDVVGWRVDDVVQLIRGEKGTTVRLNVIPAKAENDMETTVISIVRDTVKLEEQSAKKEIVEVQRGGETYRIGVIDLPTFYIDFEALQRRDPNYRSSTRDVQRLIEELKEEDIDGLVMDLRGNGGGSLSEANALVGLFIRRGPTVQVRDAEGNTIPQGDTDPSVTYEGPLAVLVNRLSASASEIFAGAIQDYQRGLVLGSQTFGKGTVQELIPMDSGQMKITRAKFYRISGESTQHKGVAPDISFPDLLSTADDLGESSLPHALPWDTIEPNYYRAYADLQQVLGSLRERHTARIAEDPDFVYIQAQIERALQKKEDNTLSLNEQELLDERAENDRWRLNVENARRVAKGKEPLASIEELEEEGGGEEELLNVNSAGLDAEEEEEDAGDPDPYLVESGQVLLDLIEMQEADRVTVAGQ